MELKRFNDALNDIGRKDEKIIKIFDFSIIEDAIMKIPTPSAIILFFIEY